MGCRSCSPTCPAWGPVLLLAAFWPQRLLPPVVPPRGAIVACRVGGGLVQVGMVWPGVARCDDGARQGGGGVGAGCGVCARGTMPGGPGWAAAAGRRGRAGGRGFVGGIGQTARYLPWPELFDMRRSGALREQSDLTWSIKKLRLLLFY